MGWTKGTAAALVALLIATLVAPAAVGTTPEGTPAEHRTTSARSFTDVPPNHPFHDEIAWMADQGITTGFPDNTFRPTAPVTRQAMAAFMRRLSDVLGGPTQTTPPTFSDVPPTHPFYEDIAWMVHHGITTGFPDNTFRPAAPVTRQAMAAFMQRLSNLLGGPTETGPPGVRDVSPTHPFYDEIAWMVHSGVSTGFADGTFRPASSVTRQAMAAFMQRLAELLGGSDSICLTQTQLPVIECRGLQALFDATGGPGWWDNHGWLTHPQPCLVWYGVLCENPPDPAARWTVVGLALGRNGLVGRLPSQIRNLSNLGELDLFDNALSGPLTPEMTQLTSLSRLDLDGNDLSGPIPAGLATLPELRSLHLGANRLEGPVPTTWASPSFLQTLSLYDNDLSGPIPASLGNLSQLRTLDLDGNRLSGSIPATLGNLGSLQVLSLDDNALTGAVPPSLGGLSHLRWLTLNDNALAGLLPPQLMELGELVTLRLRGNGCLRAEEGGRSFLEWLASFDPLWADGC